MSLVLDSNDRAQVADQAGFDIPAGADFLLEGWFRPTTAPSTYADGFGKDSHYIFNFEASGYLTSRVQHSIDGSMSHSDTSVLSILNWHHVMLLYDYSAGIFSTYVGGNRVGTTTGISVSGGLTDGASSAFHIGDLSAVMIGNIAEIYATTDITGYDPSQTTITIPTAPRSAGGSIVFGYHCDEDVNTTLDNFEGTVALDLAFDSAPNDPSWDSGVAGPYAAVASIDTLDTPILDGEQDNSFTVLNTTGNVNEVLLGSVEGINSIDVTASLTGSGLGPYTYDYPDVAGFIIDTAGLAFDSASWTNYLQAATTVDGSFQATIVINPAVGYRVIEAVNPLKDAGHVYEDFVGIPVSTDQVLYESTNNTNNTLSDYFEIEADGTILTNITSGTVHCVYWDSSDTTWKPFDITISAAGIFVTGSLSLLGVGG